MYDKINARAEALRPALSAQRRDFHRYAEPGWLEMRTASIIAKKLTDLGYEVYTGRDVCESAARMGVPDAKTLSEHYDWAEKNGAEPAFLAATEGGFTGVVGVLRCGAGPTQMNVGTLHAGSGRNVVCELAKLEIEVRGETSEANNYMEAYARRILEGAAKMHECALEITAQGAAAALVCDWPLSERVRDVAKDKLGMRVLTLPALAGGSEDFAYMAEHVQQHGGKATCFGILTACPAINHNDRFDFDESALVNGVRVFTGTVLELMGESAG